MGHQQPFINYWSCVRSRLRDTGLMRPILLLLIGASLAGACRDSSSLDAPAPASGAVMAPPSTAPAAASDDGDGAHAHAAPRGGALVELGDEFAHLELVLDQGTGVLTAYVLDGEAERAVRVAQPTIDLWLIPPGRTPHLASLDAVANALTGETRGDTSQFRAAVPALAGAATFEGSVRTVVVRGQEFRDVPIKFPAAARE